MVIFASSCLVALSYASYLFVQHHFRKNRIKGFLHGGLPDKYAEELMKNKNYGHQLNVKDYMSLEDKNIFD